MKVCNMVSLRNNSYNTILTTLSRKPSQVKYRYLMLLFPLLALRNIQFDFRCHINFFSVFIAQF